MIDYKLKLSYNDIAIIPALCSNIQHRAECIPYNEDGFLPLFTAPMSSVVDDKNFNIFEENKIHAIIPRTVDLEIRINFFLKEKWIALSLTEFENLFLSNDKTLNFNNGYVLIDIANGHMNKLFDLVKKAKEIYKTQLKIMIGNIANPLAYKKVFECNADYVRLGIGGGKGCITSSNTGIHYPMASLIYDTNKYRKKLSKKYSINMTDMPKIIADGGIRNYSDIIKALALGADYVMCGYIFSKMYESSGKHMINTKINDAESLLNEINKISFENEEEYKKTLCKSNLIIKKYYGMSTKKAQLEINHGNKKMLKTSEGKEEDIVIEYTINGWIQNFKHYLSSAMSYCDSYTLRDFRRKSNIIVMTANSYNSVNK